MGPLDFSIRPDMPADIVIDNARLQDLSHTLDSIFAYYRGDAPPESVEPSRAAIQQLRLLLGKTVELRPAIWGEFVDEQSEMLRLTQEQYQLLESLQLHNRALIWGCAGSGKTLIAAEKAARLSQQGFRVLLTCFNKGLAAFLRERLAPITSKPGVTLDIANFHDLCEQLAAEAGIPLENKDDVTYFGEELPMALMEAADQLQLRYDAIVVDEGQDFQDNWWASLQYLLQHPEESIFYIFYDEQQRIYPNTGNFPLNLQPHLLTRNCRNTKSIHRLMSKFYSGQFQITAQGPVGRPVEVIPTNSSSALATKLREVLDDLTTRGRVPNSEIVILTPSRARTTLWKQPLSGPVALTDHWPPEPGCVYCTTVHAFKGLEASVVLLVELDLWPTDRVSLDAVLYVASSRARNHLVVFLPDATPAKVRAKFT
jgi:superfamily I DNA/RNA helicase